jgi:hypothetical protein
MLQAQAEPATPYEAPQPRNTPTMHQAAQGYLFNTLANTEAANTLNDPAYRYQELKKQSQTTPKNTRKPMQPTKQMTGALPLPFDVLEAKRQLLREKAQHRIQELTHRQTNGLSEDILKEYTEVPAYLRKGIQLEELNMIPEKDIIRYYLSEQTGKEPDVEVK